MLRSGYGTSRQCHISIWKVVLSTVEFRLSVRWLSGSPIIRIVPHLMAENVSPKRQMYIINYVLMFYLCVNKCAAWNNGLYPLQTAIVASFQRKIQLSGFSAYPDSSPSRLIRISGVLLYILHELQQLWLLCTEICELYLKMSTVLGF